MRFVRAIITTVVVVLVLGAVMALLDVDPQIRAMVLLVAVVMTLIGTLSRREV